MKLTNNKLERLIMEVLNETTIKPEDIVSIEVYHANDKDYEILEKNKKGQWTDESNKVVDLATVFKSGKYTNDPEKIDFYDEYKTQYRGNEYPNLMTLFSSSTGPQNNQNNQNNNAQNNQNNQNNNAQNNQNNQNNNAQNNQNNQNNNAQNNQNNQSTGLEDFDLLGLQSTGTIRGSSDSFSSIPNKGNLLDKHNKFNSEHLKPDATGLTDKEKITVLMGLYQNYDVFNTQTGYADSPNIKDDNQRPGIIQKYFEAFFDHTDKTKSQLGFNALKAIGVTPDPTNLISHSIKNLTDFQFDVKDVIGKQAPADGPLGQALEKVFSPKELGDFAKLSEQLLFEDKNVIDLSDFGMALLNPIDNIQKRKAIQAIRIANNLDDDTKPDKQLAQVKALVKALELPGAVSKIDPEAGEDYEAGAVPTADLADIYGKPRNEVPRYVVDLFNGLELDELPTMTDRINRINALTTGMFGRTRTGTDPATLKRTQDTAPDLTIGEVVSGVAVVDVMSKIVRQFDAKSGGWVFESFLAQLANGTTEGALLGAADFSFGSVPAREGDTTKKGSAKLLQSTKFSQAATTMGEVFEKDGDSMVYIVGVKRGTEIDRNLYDKPGSTVASRKQARATQRSDYEADPEKKLKPTGVETGGITTQVDIYRITLIRDDSINNSKILNLTSKETNKISLKSGNIEFQPNEKGLIGTLYVGFDQADLNEKFETQLANVSASLPNLLKSINVFSQSTKSYLAGDRKESAMKSLEAYVNLKELINEVFADKSAETGVISTTGDFITGDPRVGITESIRTLDQLIAETIRGIKRRRK